jgi:hypothetical protein
MPSTRRYDNCGRPAKCESCLRGPKKCSVLPLIAQRDARQYHNPDLDASIYSCYRKLKCAGGVPTLGILVRYAEAVGKHLHVTLEDG